ncbi:MAG: hypothetical protein AAB176_13920 [Pseudomonadota bacterium]|jgi:hypothetical protein
MKLYLAVPTHSHTVTVETAITLLELTRVLPQRGMAVQTVFHSASMISHLRNTIVADFLASDATHLFMLDADQGLPPELVLRMLDCGHPLVGALYPRRNFSWAQIDLAQVPQAEAQAQADVLRRQAQRFVGEVLLDAQGQLTVIHGFARARSIGGGAMLIRREVIERLCTHYPELHGTGFPDEDENLPRAAHNWGFFNPLVKHLDGRNAGEDVGFCQRWTDMGGEIWAEVMTDTVHVGRQPVSGNLWTHLQLSNALAPAAGLP